MLANIHFLPSRAAPLAIALTLGACGGGTIDDTAPSGAATDAQTNTVTVIDEEVLSSFEVDGQKISFLRSERGGRSHLALQAIGSIGQPDAVATVQRREGELTMLEWFHALAPTGLPVPPALAQAHAGEALAMGRSDLSARPLKALGASATPAGDIPEINMCTGFMFGATKKAVRPRKTGFEPTVPYLCMGGKSGSAFSLPTASSCNTTFTNSSLVAGACIPTYRDTLTRQTGSASIHVGHELVTNGSSSFVLRTPVTLQVNGSMSRREGRDGSDSHTVVSAATSSTEELEVVLAVDD